MDRGAWQAEVHGDRGAWWAMVHTEAAWYAMSKISTMRGGQVEMKQTLDFWHHRNTEEHILFSQNSRGKEENKTQPLY